MTVQPLEKKEIRDRIADWVRRLEALYEEVESWRTSMLPGSESATDRVFQRDEGIMRDHKVKPVRVPTYTVLSGETKIAFVPAALWVIGANGRVNITANHPPRQYILVDTAGNDGRPSEWKIAVRDPRKLLVPFNRTAFRRLAEDRL